MNNTRKWLIGIGIVGALCVAACGVLYLVFRQAGTQLGRSFKTDATGVAEVGNKIADFETPPGYRQAFGMSFLMYDSVAFEPVDDPAGMMIFLMQFKGGSAYSSEQMEKTLQEQSGQQGTNMKVVRTYQTTIRDQTSTVVVEEGTGTGQFGVTIRQLFTAFQGRGGTVMLMMSGTASAWDQALADQFMASIR